MEQKGYQIIEPRLLDPLCVQQPHGIFLVALLTWLCGKLRSDLCDHVEAVDFEVIRVTYMGSYPAIGLHYKNKEHTDIGPLVQAAIERILRETPLATILQYIGQSGVNWQQATVQLMGHPK